jgi:hypothetical protein
MANLRGGTDQCNRGGPLRLHGCCARTAAACRSPEKNRFRPGVRRDDRDLIWHAPICYHRRTVSIGSADVADEIVASRKRARLALTRRRSCRLTVRRFVLGWPFSTTARAVTSVSGREMSFEVSTSDLRFTKKQQFAPTNGGRIEGHVMVHRTDIAGSSMGQIGSGSDAMRRTEWCLPASFARTSARVLLRRRERPPCAQDGSPRALSSTPGPVRY